ncbi:MAG: OprO/OprP family phosphate-selective porin [Flavobacterium sp.]|jgi:phosphate-selective porin OprO and OprP|nr:OprO/OprP family phosphate-selective porin [Flavobacterium sp.]MDP5027573.1 OprO/OprP family phosphate-selective porin [Flavobacterium sp.]MDP5097926.1 OprO/OprP family phosphate-selective porin [Flavobacterium sp.]
MKKIATYLLLLVSAISIAQEIKLNSKDNDLKLAALPYYNYGKGLGITSPDSLFQLNIRFRMQNRVTFIQNEDENAAYSGEIRRLRLRFDGYVGNPHFLYVIQLSFAPGDVGEIQDGENINIIRDAAVFYRPNKNWSFLFGQTKLPGNRQRVNSSGALQLTDRSINNARFTIDRDFGFQAYYLNQKSNQFSYNIKSAISTGEGRNWTKSSDDGVALTGKIELMPFGSFKNDGTNFEGDVAREEKPRLLLSGAFSQNNLSKRTQGQLGADLFESKTTKSVFLDAMLKYNGWSFMSAYMSRSAKDPIAFNPDDITDFNYVPVGSGMDYQMSYVFTTNYEIIGRFSTQKMHQDIQTFTPNSKQYSIGVTKYLWEHAFKLQGEVTLSDLDYFDGSNKQNWYVRFQLEIGI